MFSRSCKISVKRYLVKLCGCSFTRAFATKRSDIIYVNAFCAIVELQMWWKIHPESILISKDAYLKLFFRDTYCFIHFWCCFCLTVMNKFLLLCRGTRGWKKSVLLLMLLVESGETQKNVSDFTREENLGCAPWRYFSSSSSSPLKRSKNKALDVGRRRNELSFHLQQICTLYNL